MSKSPKIIDSAQLDLEKHDLTEYLSIRLLRGFAFLVILQYCSAGELNSCILTAVFDWVVVDSTRCVLLRSSSSRSWCSFVRISEAGIIRTARPQWNIGDFPHLRLVMHFSINTGILRTHPSPNPLVHTFHNSTPTHVLLYDCRVV